jgi:hypothetical protein
MGALIDDLFDPPLGECGRCHRRTWAKEEVGREDRVQQPDGYPCGGMIDPTPAASVGDTP